MTPMQRRMMSFLLLTPGQSAGQIQRLLELARWTPAPRRQMVTRSLTALIARDLVYARIPGHHDLQFFLTEKGKIEILRAPIARVA